jgi:cysteine-S-conjugate beta-lyase
VDDPLDPLGPLDRLTLDELRARHSLKWRAHGPDVLPVWVAEMDATPAPGVVAELERIARTGDTGYAWGTDYPRALRAFAADRWGWDIEVARTVLLPDVMRGSAELLRLVTEPGAAVVVNPPVYPPFFAFIRHIGRRVVHAPLGDDGRLDLAVLDAAFGDATAQGTRGAAYLLCSPHNPTGTVHTEDELRGVARLATTHGVRIVADEVHAPLTLPGATFVPLLALPEAQAAFAVHSASKGWNLAGAKAAVGIAGDDAGDDLDRLLPEVTHGASHLGVRTHTAALTEDGPWLDAVVAAIAARRRLLADLLGEHLPEVAYRPGDATFLAWLDCRRLGLGDDPAAVFLERGRVACTPGVDFGPGGHGHVRLNLATSAAILREAVARLAV